jgi:hypothetical protein
MDRSTVNDGVKEAMKAKDKDRLQAVCSCVRVHVAGGSALARSHTHTHTHVPRRLRWAMPCTQDEDAKVCGLTLTLTRVVVVPGSIFPPLVSFVASRPCSREPQRTRDWTPFRTRSASPSCESSPSSARRVSRPTPRSMRRLLHSSLPFASWPAFPLTNHSAALRIYFACVHVLMCTGTRAPARGRPGVTS